MLFRSTATRRKMIDDARACAVEAEKAQGLEALKQYTEVLVEHKRKLEREMAGETNKLVPLFPLKLAIGRVNTALDKLKGAAADDNMLRVRQLLGNNADPQTIVMLEMISALKGMSVKNNQDSGVRSSVPDWPKFNDNIVNYFRFKTALLAHISDFYSGVSQESLVTQVKKFCLTPQTRDLVSHKDSVNGILQCLDLWYDRPHRFVESAMESFKNMKELHDKDMSGHYKHYTKILVLMKEAEDRGQTANLLTACNMEAMLDKCAHEERRFWWEQYGRGEPTAAEFAEFVRRRHDVACFEMGRTGKPVAVKTGAANEQQKKPVTKQGGKQEKKADQAKATTAAAGLEEIGRAHV